ncbi:asparagine synthase (glutamine-hydrolyzing) [Flagellimonas olearia]|uniref:asparagine synthase (glutamine-hydrolyzing) n=1 Tax=Flagellimonas olearia TaxID=552546 RepID=A0A6I1E3M8_9FLAO|nr:asparagine synthase (glutamine-hydrolyzing) [Allomuricauda olearia]KAB7530500.1 asparagine synthase (glutamine-hydrolyzing) [Allomuricauda olearia]
MCGIYLTNIPFEEENVRLKLESIKYRGPDHMGIQKKDNLYLGHLRLSILDLDPRSNQPMRHGHLYIVFNGEIYNYKDLKVELQSLGHTFCTESDTEVLLVGYQEWGEALLQKINGMFAFCIYDEHAKTIFCARDRLGVKPFYYYWKDGTFEICSQIQPLLKGKKVDEEAVSIYLDCMFIPSPYTIVKDVYKLPPGNFMTINLNDNSKTINEYWNLKPVSKKKRNYALAKEELKELLFDAVKIRLQSDVPIGAFLSGGIDSALVSSIAMKVSKDPINTFSVGFDVKEYDESQKAEEYATIIGSNHRTIICRISDISSLIPKVTEIYGEPFADSSALPTLLLNAVAKNHVTVALAGDGGDESFLGYTYFDSLIKHKSIIDIPFGIRKFLSKPVFLNFIGQNNHRVRNALLTKDRNGFIENIFSRKGMLLKTKQQGWMKHYQGYKSWSNDFLQKAADLNIKLWLENDSNVKVDRASMASSVEVRSPFLDYRIIEFARTLPVSFRYQRNRQKRILRDLLNEYIPETIFNQPKKGFSIPLAKWIREDLKDEFKNTLNDDFLTRVPNLNVSKCKSILDEHFTGQADHSANIWKLYMLAKWYTMYDKMNTI